MPAKLGKLADILYRKRKVASTIFYQSNTVTGIAPIVNRNICPDSGSAACRTLLERKTIMILLVLIGIGILVPEK